MLNRILAGAIGGLAGTWAMNEAQRAWTRAVDGAAPASAGGKHDARDWQERTEGRNSNEIAAQILARHLIGHRLDGDALAAAAVAMHYSFGASVSAVYGAIADRRPRVGRGVVFGLTVWLLADEIAMPLLGLSASTARRPAEKRLQSMAAHIVFGAATELARAFVVSQLDARTSDADSHAAQNARADSVSTSPAGTHITRPAAC